MTIEQQPIDITNLPKVARLTDEVHATRRPRVLRRANEDVAMLIPLAGAVLTPMPASSALNAVLAGVPADDPVARTAGILHTDQPFLGYDEEKEAAALIPRGKLRTRASGAQRVVTMATDPLYTSDAYQHFVAALGCTRVMATVCQTALSASGTASRHLS